MKSRKLDYANFGKRLRARRLQLKITQIDLGKQTGLTASYIGHLEKGYRAPSADALISLCNALKISPDFLLQDQAHVSRNRQHPVLLLEHRLTILHLP